MGAANHPMVSGQVPSFVRVAAGDYETFDGRYRMHRLCGVRPPAWNVEDTEADVWVTGQATEDVIVDGAASMRDAFGLFTDWWRRVAADSARAREV